mgnify:CR=1 FL=1
MVYKKVGKELSADDADIKQQVANRFEPLLNALKNQHLPNELLEFSNLLASKYRSESTSVSKRSILTGLSVFKA